jgi:aminoglycoside phosphotransferase (APT) family kinase protein
MPFIPPKERFSTNAKSVNIAQNVLREAMSQFGRPGHQVAFQRLSGGFMNANYLATVDDERVLVRVYSTDATTAARECDLLKFLASEDVLVPGVLARLHVGNRPVAILEFIDGITLEDRLLQEDGPSPLVYREIGRQLATIHRITFAETGFLGPHLQVGHEYDNFSVFLKQFI